MAVLVPLSACGGDDGTGSSGAGGSSSGGATSSSGGTSSTTTGSGGMGGESHGASAAQCEAIGELCHPVDDGDGPLHECHDLGHIGDPEVCAERFDDCITMCLAAAEEHGEGGAGGDHAHGEGSDLCDFIGSFCHEVDDGDGPLHDCHELGHDGTPEMCMEQAEECVTMCAAAREAAGGAGGGGGAGGA